MSLEERLSKIKGTEPGEFRVTVDNWEEPVLEWEGFAENVSDALHKALDQREAEFGGEEA